MGENAKLLCKGNETGSWLRVHLVSASEGPAGAAVSFVGGEVVQEFRQVQCLLGFSPRFLGHQPISQFPMQTDLIHQ